MQMDLNIPLEENDNVGFDLNIPILEDENNNEEDENAEDVGDAPIVDDDNDDLDINSFDLNLPLDEFGVVDFDFVQNNLGK
ncbi:unnamed protein product [Urochloa humidicola]